MPRLPHLASRRQVLWWQRLLLGLSVPVLALALLVFHPDPSWAASGGRIGGGSFRSAPSMPRSYGGGGYRGGYGGGYSRGGYGGGGIGFPFLIPFFGFGGGGLFGFLVLMAVIGLITNALRGVGPALAGGDGGGAISRPDGPVSLVQVQVGLLASARALQQDLRRLAATADTSSSSGLMTVLQETTLALLRHPDLWVYAGLDVGQVPFASAEATFNRLTMAERSKLSRELTTNVAGRRDTPAQSEAITAGDSDAASDFIVVTVLAATRQRLTLKGAASAEQLRSSLQALGGLASEDLLALEVIWQPDGAGDVLSTEELLTAYPDLQHL
ncbi:MAG: DUF1517 domain-containing protein [Cyanobacteria bacterium M_surface_10_m2_119]|nr:DUF1517 domain-containing protein [Cyanobacteria bacterium M_surface_10_m2_119]